MKCATEANKLFVSVRKCLLIANCKLNCTNAAVYTVGRKGTFSFNIKALGAMLPGFSCFQVKPLRSLRGKSCAYNAEMANIFSRDVNI